MDAAGLDRHGATSLTCQIRDWLRGAIQRGDLPPSTRMPSTRTLAKHLHVSRNTVLSAYEALAVEGLIVGRTGSGTRISGRPHEAAAVRESRLSARRLLRAAQYPARSVRVRDPDGNLIWLH